MKIAYIIWHDSIQLPAIDRRYRPVVRNRPASTVEELWDQWESFPDHDNAEVARFATEAEALNDLAQRRCSSWESGGTVYGELYWLEPYTIDEDGDPDESQGIDHWAQMES